MFFSPLFAQHVDVALSDAGATVSMIIRGHRHCFFGSSKYKPKTDV